MSRRLVLCIAFMFALGVALASSLSLAGPGETTRASISTAGSQGSGDSGSPSVSADGRYVAFYSRATTLVGGDTNGCVDIFVRDRFMRITKRVSVSSTGAQSDGDSWAPVISADGRYVAFESVATNLVADDTNKAWDVFVHDCRTGVTERVSISSSAVQANANSFGPSISSDGRYVAFQSQAANLVAGDTNGFLDIFVRDRVGRTTERLSISTARMQGNGVSRTPSISGDGRYVAFVTMATNLVADDTNGSLDVLVRDRVARETVRVSVDDNGVQGDGDSDFPSINGDGAFIAFQSQATNLVGDDTNAKCDVFVHHRDGGRTERVSVSSTGSQGNGSSTRPSITSDGRYVAFVSDATRLITEDLNSRQDAFMYDRNTGETSLVSVTTAGVQADNNSYVPAFSPDGHYVAFESDATNLVPDDTNATTDIFMHQLLPDIVLPEFHDVGILGLRIYPRKWAQGVANQLAIMDIGNFGNVTETAVRVKWLLDDDANFNDAATDPTPPVEIGSKNNVALASGEKKTIQITLTPSWPLGIYYLMGRVEPTLGKTDIDRPNNSKQAKIEIVAIDLKVTDIAWNSKKGAIIVTVTNEGPSRGFGRVSLMVAGTRVLYHDEQDAYFFAEVGQSKDIEFAYTPASATTRYKIEARVSPTDGIPDAHPSDNYRTETLKLP